MAKNLRFNKVTTRKPHICFGCGTVDSYYLCSTCADIVYDMASGDEYGFGDLKDEALEREEAKK